MAVVGQAAIRMTLEDGVGTDKDATGMAVRYLLQLLADLAPGNTVEVRVPPYGAVQCIEGPAHTRGTPPNVIEMDAATWIALATGTGSVEGSDARSAADRWAAAVASGSVSASGSRASLADRLPLDWGAHAG